MVTKYEWWRQRQKKEERENKIIDLFMEWYDDKIRRDKEGIKSRAGQVGVREAGGDKEPNSILPGASADLRDDNGGNL